MFDKGTGTHVFDDDGAMTRRSAMRAAALTAALGLATASGIAIGAESNSADATPATDLGSRIGAGGPLTRTPVAEAGRSTVRSAVEQAARPARPVWAGTWKSAIRVLDPGVGKRLHTRFPSKGIMLTIDDGPHPVWTPRYLRLLAKYNVHATFCVIGMQVKGNEHLIRAAVSEGHHIANHTFHHPLNLPSMSAKSIHRELTDTSDAIVRASGFRPSQFRAPGGVWGHDVFVEVSKQNMMPLGWDIDPRDWSLPGVTAIKNAMLEARPHDIILCHDGGGDRAETYEALTKVIPELLHRGYQFVTLPAPQ